MGCWLQVAAEVQAACRQQRAGGCQPVALPRVQAVRRRTSAVPDRRTSAFSCLCVGPPAAIKELRPARPCRYVWPSESQLRLYRPWQIAGRALLDIHTAAPLAGGVGAALQDPRHRILQLPNILIAWC